MPDAAQLAQALPDAQTLKALVEIVGPVGAFATLALGLLFYFYRRDHLRKQNGLREAHDRRDRRDALLIEVIQRNAAASEAQARASDALAASIGEARRQYEETLRDFHHQQTEVLRDLLREMRER